VINEEDTHLGCVDEFLNLRARGALRRLRESSIAARADAMGFVANEYIYDSWLSLSVVVEVLEELSSARSHNLPQSRGECARSVGVVRTELHATDLAHQIDGKNGLARPRAAVNEENMLAVVVEARAHLPKHATEDDLLLV